MRHFAQKISLAAVLAFSGSALFADTVTATGASAGQMWQSWNASQANNSGTPYWNNISWDGGNKNVGSCLTTSNCGMSNTPGALPYLGKSNGQAYSDFYFTGIGATVTATLVTEITGAADYDYFGWYNVQNPNQYGIIFSPGTSVGTTATFNPSTQYGLFFLDAAPNVNQVYLSQSSLGSDAGQQHFALFQGSGSSYYVGAEDLPRSNSDFDYNDMIVKLSTTSPAPEPGALLLVGAGITALGAFRLRRNKVKSTEA